MSVYQSGSGQWIFFDGTTKHYFDTQGEAQIMLQKTNFAKAVQAIATTVAQEADKAGNLMTVFFDRGYNGGGANPITDEDVEGLGITAAQVAAFITFAENFGKLLNNEAPFQSDYDAVLNQLRTDV